MDRGLEWYKRDPRAMIDAKRAANDGLGLTMRQAAVFDLVIDLIYEGAGQTPNSPRYFASHFRDMGIRAAREAVQSLIDMGKLNEKDGMIYSSRATLEAQARKELSEKRSESGKKGGKNSAKTREKLSKNSQETQQKLNFSSESPEVFGFEIVENMPEKPNENNKTAQANASSKIQAEKIRGQQKQKEPPLGTPKKANSDSNSLFGDDQKKPPKKKKRACQLPQGWVPNEKNIEDAKKLDFTDWEIENEGNQFRDYHHAKASTYVDWDACWRTWIRNAIKFGRRTGAQNGRGMGVDAKSTDVPS